jgi:hypothetical protein
MKRCLALFVALALTSVAFATPLPPIQTVFVIVLENHDWNDIVGNTNAPYMNNTLLPMAAHCEQYYNPPASHPSLRNYLWLEAGTDFGIPANNTPAVYHQSTTNHFSAQLQAAGISWKSYQEDICGTVVPLNDVNGYAVRHNPFMYFDDVTGTNNPNWPYGIAHVRPYSELAGDLANHTVARYNFITPNLCDDGHNSCPPLNNLAAQADTWLSAEIPKILASSAYSNNGAIFITWDEGVGDDGPIGLIALSPLVRRGGYSSFIHYSHSSLLRTLQEIYHVGPYLNDATNATDLSELFMPFGVSESCLVNSGFQFKCSGVAPGITSVVEASTDLFNWMPIMTNEGEAKEFTVFDPGAINFSQRFYRVRQSQPGAH